MHNNWIDEKSSMHSERKEKSFAKKTVFAKDVNNFPNIINKTINVESMPKIDISLKGKVDVETTPSTATEYKERKLFVDFPASLSAAS